MTQREEVIQESYEVRWTPWEKLLMSGQVFLSFIMVVLGFMVLSKIPADHEFKKPNMAREPVVYVNQIEPIVTEDKEIEIITPTIEPVVESKFSYLESTCKEYDLDLDQIKRQIFIESRGNPKANGSFGERGLMQICRLTWDDMVERMGVDWTFDQAYDPKKNLTVGCYYLNYLKNWVREKGYPETTRTALVAYNCGMGNVSRGTVPNRSWRYASRIIDYPKSTGDINWDSLFR